MTLFGNDEFDAAAAADVIAGHLAAATVHLGQTNMTVDRNTTKAEMTAAEATYSGYAAETITWLAPSIGSDGEVEVVGIVGEFRPTSSVITNSIYTAYILSAVGGTPLCFVARFDNAPIGMGTTLDSIVVTVRWRPRTGGLVITVD